MRQDTADRKVKVASPISQEPSAVREDVAHRIETEFERYREMRDAVRKESGKWRRSQIAHLCN
jgi:hypothetical protein